MTPGSWFSSSTRFAIEAFYGYHSWDEDRIVVIFLQGDFLPDEAQRFCYAVRRNPIPPSKRDYFMHDQAVGVQTRGYRCRAAVPRWLQHVLEEFPMRLGVPPRHVSPYIFALDGHLCANFEYPISAVQHRAGYGVWAEPAEETAQII